MGIFLYLMWEVIPLFRSTSGELVATAQVSEAQAFPSNTTVIGSDEYQEVVFVLAGNRLQFLRMPQGTPVPDAGGERMVSGTVQSSVLIGQKGNRVSVATQEGMVVPVTVHFRPIFEGNNRTIMPTSQVGKPIRVIPDGEELVHHAHTQQDERQVIVAVTASGNLWLTQMEEPGEFSFSDEMTITQRQLEIPEQTTITHVVLDSFGRRLVAGTKQGELLEWLLKDGGANINCRYTSRKCDDLGSHE
jgi:phosphate transport system permease protein